MLLILLIVYTISFFFSTVSCEIDTVAVLGLQLIIATYYYIANI